MTRTRQSLLLLLLALAVCLAGCGASWQAAVVAPDGTSFPVDRDFLAGLPGWEDGAGVALEQVLWAAGHEAVERLIVVDGAGQRHELDWTPAVAEAVLWQPDGQVAANGQMLDVARIEVVPPALLGQVQARITDLAPTAAAALELPAPGQATGQPRQVPPARRVLLLFLDGLGYVRYGQARQAGLVPNLALLGEPLTGLTTYPPTTAVSSASLLTGAPPAVHGVDQRGIRQTETETLLDVAAAAGLRVVAVEGDALAFNLRNAEVQLSGDRDGNGSTDDNVLANALAVLAGGMPDLFYVHFHGIDDAGHTYGPGAAEEMAAIQGVDAAVGELLAAVPPETLIIIFADHGMHPVEEEGRLGNHGHLVEEDMFIPILFVGPFAPQE